ncbi:probable xyloglucan endotransglucosylase/hydrolase protein 26 [Zingiber officinale]|uniref:probable xyloglucan endotransglucosylase/hydrolase protein 26 n=1 Tax=Zingiber officinale TaxID=94328 RepID=UPI001C4B3A85|nr:probable xyloglucan endotransglucosylase/hydrolase protein 26 [Zingiber officinale]
MEGDKKLKATVAKEQAKLRAFAMEVKVTNNELEVCQKRLNLQEVELAATQEEARSSKVLAEDRPCTGLAMATLHNLIFGFVLLVAMEHALADFNFYKDMACYWGYRNLAVWNNGQNFALGLNNVSGCGIQTRNRFLFGSVEMQIKLVHGNSAGTVTTYYISSTGSKHDEIDFEFLGNVSGQPYIIHTNIWAQGLGRKEVQFYPWFDPTAAFHNYTIHWNPSQIVWFIDGIPIRVFRNYQSYGIAFPNQQAMRAYSSIWNGDSWATRGGQVKINWKSAPFRAFYQQVKLRTCPWYSPASTAQCSAKTPANWWTAPAYSRLSYAQQGQLMWVRKNYMIYNYCQDWKRFKGVLPPECSLPLY